jgi:hypothetical protein
MLTLRTYAHAMREEEADLGFANFHAVANLGNAASATDSPKRPYTAPAIEVDGGDENAPTLRE